MLAPVWRIDVVHALAGDLPLMRTLRTLALPAAAVLVLAACSDSTAPEAGRLSLLLTDAPGDVRTAVVTISQIYLQGSDAEEAPPQGERNVLREEDVTVDLLTLEEEMMSLVEGAEIPGGRYAQLRFVITGGYIEVEQADGSLKLYASSPTYAGIPEDKQVHGTLIMPSFAQSGLKVNLPGDQLVIDGNEQTFLVDFNVSQSFGQQAGASGTWVMHPVIQATEVPHDTESTIGG
jgi:hypothetical protein